MRTNDKNKNKAKQGIIIIILVWWKVYLVRFMFLLLVHMIDGDVRCIEVNVIIMHLAFMERGRKGGEMKAGRCHATAVIIG